MLMRQIKTSLILVCIFVNFIGFAQNHKPRAFNDADGIFYLKSGDGVEEYTVNGQVTFKASTSGKAPTYRDAGVTFIPAKEGDLISISVSDIDIDGSSNYLLLYDGAVKIGYYGASDGVGQSSYMPTGWVQKIGSPNSGLTYTSTAADGKLTIGYHSGSMSNNEKGFTIIVNSVTPKDMEFVSSKTISGATTVNRGSKNQVIAGVNVVASGSLNPLKLNELSFPTSTLSSSQVGNMRIYKSSQFTEENLLASAATIGDNISFTKDVALTNGDNKFFLVADINPDAIGSLGSVNVASLKINGASQMPETTTMPSMPSVVNDILISSTSIVYTISDAANFYDDGGKGGKISSNFNGTITFVPADNQKKIKIDFSKLEIFNTSSVGKNDILKIYNGRNVDETQLNTTLLKEAKIVKSTAQDGSLTVSLASTTGVPANGWEGIVSQFEPSNMVVDGITASPIEGTTISASTEGAQMLLVNVKATSTLNPKTVQAISVDTKGSSHINAFKNIKVYYLGATSTFNTTKLFGETTIGDASVKVAGSQELSEGDNYFAIVCDLSSAPSNGDLINLSSGTVTISGEEINATTAATASRTIFNSFKAIAGTHTRDIHDIWHYSDNKSPYNSNLYDYDDKDCVVTFRPTISGSVAQLDIKSFDVYYSDSSYGSKAEFAVYSGTQALEENLIWKLSSNAQSTTGPGVKLRSKAADGSMTIKFNAKSGSSYYAGKGWDATVEPFVDHNMTIKAISVAQTNKNGVAPGSLNQEIIKFAVTTEGTLSTQSVKEVALNVKESLPALKGVKVMYAADKEDISNAVLLGGVTDITSPNITITGSQDLPEGVSNFFVVFDIKDEVANNVKLDAALLSIKTQDAEAYTPANGDPDGERLTKNEYILANGENGEIIVHNSLLFYDNGGKENNYTNSFDGKVTFVPSSSDKVVKMKFQSFRTYFGHYFYLYNGKSTDDANLIGKYSSSTFPDSLISTSSDGALTVRFVSTSSGSTYAGWEISVSSYTPRTLSVDSVIVSAPTIDASILRGSSDEAVQMIKVVVGGDKGSVKLNNFTFDNVGTTSVSDITAAKLYYTGSSVGYNPINLVGAYATASPYKFTASDAISITQKGTYYFWLAYDISKDASAGNVIKAKFSGLEADGTATTAIVKQDEISRTIKGGFKGEYTIGASASANYATFASAIAAMKDGVEGPVKFNVEAGTYKENILISNIKGTSAINTITFSSLSGKKEDVVISGNGYSEPAYGEQKYGMVAVANTNYVTLENMSFIPTDQSYPYALQLLAVSRHFTLRGCAVKADQSTSYNGIYLFYMKAIDTDGNNNDFVTLENNIFNGGYIALNIGGTSYVKLTKEVGAVIRGNIISDAGSKGLYMFDENGAIIENNQITTATTKTSYSGMDLFRCRGNMIVRNNIIRNNQSVYSTGISIRQELLGTLETPILVYNNAVSISNSQASSYGIDVTSDCAYISFYNNTINLNGSGGTCFSISKTYSTIKNIYLQNNLFQNNAGGGVFRINSDSQIGALSFGKNAYYTSGTSFSNKGGDTFDAWKTGMNDASSILEQAQFLSTSDMHLKAAGSLNSGITVPFIATDAEGTVRNATTPTIGAYEYANVAVIKPVMTEGYPTIGEITYNSAKATTKWNVSGKLYTMVLPSAEVAPTEESLLAQTATDVSANVELTSVFSNLEGQKTYKIYFLMVSVLDAKSDILSSEAFTTLRYIAPLSVSVPASTTTTDGTSVNVAPTISGGLWKYGFEWRNQMNEVVSTDSVLNISPSVSSQYHLIVKSADGQTITSYTDVLVKGAASIATFEDNYLASDSYWQGREDANQSNFFSGSYSFTNTYYPSLKTWGGFAYSNVAETTFDQAQFLTQQFRSGVGHGVNNSDTYAILYTYGMKTWINVTNSDEGMIIPGVYLANAAYTLHSINSGDAIAGDKYKTGDYFSVVFTGVGADGKTTSSVTYYLADYRSENEADHFIQSDWKWFDLSSLGVVKTVKVTIKASRNTTPYYLCMDNLGATSPVSGINDVSAAGVKIYPVPAHDVLNIEVPFNSYRSDIYSIDGSLMQTANHASGKDQIDISSLAPGNYILRISGEEGLVNKHFIKR